MPGTGSGQAGPGGEQRAPAPTTRRRLLGGAGALGAVVGLGALGAVGAGTGTGTRPGRRATDPRSVIPLWSATVAYDSAEQRALVGGRSPQLPLDPGTRFGSELAPSSPARARAEEFLQGTAEWQGMLRESLGDLPALLDLAGSALWDLWVLTDELPAPVAGWSSSWRYMWPRDAAFCAAALARIVHRDTALSVLEHLGSLQARDGWFEARYDPATGRAPDRRPRQFDGAGLLLWAASEAVPPEGEEGRDRALERLAPLITRSLGTLHRCTSGGTGLPPVSPDYWEVHEESVTLGTMAATLTGLQAGARVAPTSAARRTAQQAARSFTALCEGTFGTTGFQRYRSGGGADSALALLDATGVHDVAAPAQLLSLREELARPGGGIAPGASWREDGVSWTPSTSLLGLALARSGERTAALEILTWLAEHRTEAGSLPEKVLFDGRPAEVAPLAWTAANVLLSLDVLARG